MKKYAGIKFTIGNTDFIITYTDTYGITSDVWFAEYHMHPFAEIHIMHSGSVRLKSENKETFFNENEVCIIPPRVYHAINPLTQRIVKASLYLEIKKNNQKRHDTFSQFRKLLEEPEPLFLKCTPVYINEIIKLSSDDKNSDFMLTYKIQNLFSIIFTEIYDKIRVDVSDEYRSENISYQTELLLQIERIIDLNNLGSVAEADIAKKLHLSTTQLSRLIKKNFRCTFRELILGYKLQKATDLLKEGELSLNEIAIACGYETYAGFWRAFKKYMGTSPETYKDNLLS